MNNLLKISILFFASIVLFSSCKTMSVTKRHYNKGYYVSHSHKQKALKKTGREPEQLSSVTKEERAEILNPGTTALKMPPTEEKELIASDTYEQPVLPSSRKKLFDKRSNSYSNEEIEVRDVIKNPLKAGKMLATKDSGDDALSLLWILIVVLLIVYIVGILLDGFGLGGIIHILGVIVLVLLILWLLKII
jgi:hypothetical protein